MDLLTVLLVGVVVLGTGVSKSALAGALGVFAVPLLMLRLPATEAIALMLPILIVADALSVRSYWRQWNSQLLCLLIPGGLAGVIVAHSVVSVVSTEQLRNIIALICIVFALRSLLLSNSKIDLINNRFGALVMSGLSGFSSTLVHAGGPPLMIYLSSRGLAPKAFVATASAYFATMNLFKLAGFSLLGLLSLENIATAALFIPLALLGNRLGVHVQQGLNVKVFMKAMNVLLLILGAWLLAH